MRDGRQFALDDIVEYFNLIQGTQFNVARE
jgi:hypothetical protein